MLTLYLMPLDMGLKPQVVLLALDLKLNPAMVLLAWPGWLILFGLEFLASLLVVEAVGHLGLVLPGLGLNGASSLFVGLGNEKDSW